MAVGTVTALTKYVEGGYFTRRFNYVGPSTYTTGGDNLLPLILAIAGLGAINFDRVISVFPTNAAATAWTPVMVETFTGGKLSTLKLLFAVNGTEVTAATNLSTGTWRFVLEGS